PDPRGLLERAATGKFKEEHTIEEITDLKPGFEKAEKLRAYVVEELGKKAQKLPDTEPVVVMVHGFWYDPTTQIALGNPDESGNPHGRNYHFFEKPAEDHWRHTTGWPVRFGIKDNEAGGVAEAGANGLAVAFGWDSTPNILRLKTLDTDAR